MRNDKERAEYKRFGLEAKVQRAQREREKFVDAVNGVQCNVGKLQGLVKKGSIDFKRHVVEHWLKICQHLGTLLAGRVVEAREDHIRESCGVARLNVQSWENHLKRIKQLVQQPPRLKKAQAEKRGPGSGDNGGSNDARTSPSEFEFDADAGPSSV